jgi:crotonobetainyl-CoA:carnitine CoA-transferase CaiB-like acyl-CoA transferase
VADFTRVLAGPYATMLLGDLGASVIKVERPSGDDTRHWGPPWTGDVSSYYQSINRNKRSIVLDLTDPAAQQTAHRLAKKADVLVENFKNGGAARLGLAYETLRQANPALVYCSITGFGSTTQSAPPAYDLIVQAVSGLMRLTGPNPETPTKAGIPASDIITGLHATIGILAALRHRQVTGTGQRVEVNLLSSTLSGMVNFTGGYALTGHVPQATGICHPSICPYEAYQAADRLLIIAVGNDSQFAALCDCLHLPGLAADPRFRTNAGRVARRPQLNAYLQPKIRERTAADWAQTFGAVGVPCGPVNDLTEGIALAQQMGLEPVVEVAGVPQIASPVRFFDTPVSYRHAPPELGDSTEDVLRWLDSSQGQPVAPEKET